MPKDCVVLLIVDSENRNQLSDPPACRRGSVCHEIVVVRVRAESRTRTEHRFQEDQLLSDHEIQDSSMFSWLLPNDSRSSLSDFREISRSGPPLAGPPRGPGGPADIQGENLSVSVLPAGPFSSLIPRFVFVQLISAGSPGSPPDSSSFP